MDGVLHAPEPGPCAFVCLGSCTQFSSDQCPQQLRRDVSPARCRLRRRHPPAALRAAPAPPAAPPRRSAGTATATCTSGGGGGGGEGAAAAAGGPWGEPGWQSCSHAAPERFYRISVTGRHEPWSLPLPTAESRAEAALACASHWWFATSTRPPARPPAHPPTRQTPARRPYAHPPAHAHHSASLQMYKYCTDLKLYKNWRWSKRLSSGE